MSQQFDTIYQWRYEVSSPDECQVIDSTGRLILTAWPGTPEQFVADGQPVTLSSDSATLLPANGGKSFSADSSGGGTALPATGEPIVELATGLLSMKHATWFSNANLDSISVQPGAWKNEVMTCYLKTEVPVTLTGVRWLYGAPVMASGYTHVIALQQVDASTIIANLAYTLPQ